MGVLEGWGLLQDSAPKVRQKGSIDLSVSSGDWEI